LLFGIRFELIHLEAMCLLDQQGAIPLDLLAEALSIPLSKARRVVNTCVKLGLVRARRILVEERHPWLWLSREGASALGYRRRRLEAPKLAQLQHYLAMARIRARLTAKAEPETLRKRLWEWWRPVVVEFVAWLADKAEYEMSLKPQRGNMIHDMQWVSTWEYLGLDPSKLIRRQVLPDALIEQRDGRRIGIVIALHARSSRKFVTDFKGLRAICDEICCFCAPINRLSAKRALDRVGGVPVHIFDAPDQT
jgi:hypothetical protein